MRFARRLLWNPCKSTHMCERDFFGTFKDQGLAHVPLGWCTCEIWVPIPFMKSTLASQIPFQALGSPFWMKIFQLKLVLQRVHNLSIYERTEKLCSRDEIEDHISCSHISIVHHPHACLSSFLKEKRWVHSPLLERGF